jgi:hypothetical protein
VCVGYVAHFEGADFVGVARGGSVRAGDSCSEVVRVVIVGF